MGSQALHRWNDDAQAAFDEVEHAHTAVGGTGPGRRTLTGQLNRAYVTLIAARFQRYCRDLHTEAARALAAGVLNPALAIVLEAALTQRRRLDLGNASRSNIQEDFSRFGLNFLQAVKSHRQRNAGRLSKLEQLNAWRNAIAHHDIDARLAAGVLAPASITLATCRSWRSALNHLVVSFDAVLADQCANLGQRRPW